MTIIKELKNGKLYAEFDSVNDVFRVIDKLGWQPAQGKESDTQGGGGDFHTFKSLAEASDIFRNHPERIREFSVNDDRIERPDTPGKDVLYDVTGDFIDIDRYLSGEPENMGNAVMGNPNNIFCTINILTSYVSYTKASYLAQRQKRILRLVDWLETQGVRCQIIGSDDSAVSYISTKVKEYQDPFDLNQLAVISHGDWLRRVEFLVMEQSKTWEWGYGHSIDYDSRMLKYKPQPEDGVYIYIGGYGPYSTVKELDAAFDELEKKVLNLVDMGLTWNDEPFTVGKSYYG